MQTLFVSRHSGAKDWLEAHHPELAKTCEYVTQATPSDLEGKIVVGTLPVHLAALCHEYWNLDMEVPLAARGKEFSREDMEKFGAKLTRYKVLSSNDLDILQEALDILQEAIHLALEHGLSVTPNPILTFAHILFPESNEE
jgi:putative CRISPR-associated protein (TIGR02620 family)